MQTEKYTRRFFIGLRSAAIAFLLGALPRPAAAIMSTPNLSVASIGGGFYNFTWTAATTTPNTAYRVCARYGYNITLVADGAGSYNAPASCTGAVVDATSLAGIGFGDGSLCFGVSARASNGEVANSVQTCHSFIHAASLGNTAATTRADSAGGQLGFGQLWNFTYFLDNDALVTMKVFPPGSVFPAALATNGFVAEASSSPTKVLVSSTPRPMEGASNVETWDLRDSTGAVVSNGIYFLWGEITNPINTNLLLPNPLTAPDFVRYRGLLNQIPVDVIRLLNFSAVGIAAGAGTGSISYQVTGDAAVRIVISTPGSRFMLDANGDVQPALLDPVTKLPVSPLTSDPTAIVTVLTFNRRAGTYSESWNGTYSDNVTHVSSGVYSVAISARDAFGNRAMDAGGNDQPIAATIPVDYTVAQTVVVNPALTVTAISVDGTSILTQSPVPSLSAVNFASISATLGANPLNAAQSSLSLTGPPGGVAIAGAVAFAAGNTGMTFTPTVAPTTAGAYTVKVTATDTLGTALSGTSSYSFNLAGAAGGGGTPTQQTAEQFKNSVVSFPNPVRTPPAKINFNLTNSGTVDIDIFTLSGERLFHESQNFAAGANTFNWNLVNDSASRVGTGVFLVRVTAHDGTFVFRQSKKIIVIK